MSNFPTKFDRAVTLIDQLPNTDAVQVLGDKGYQLLAGITPEYADKIAPIAAQASIREYCPKDLTVRFADRQMVEQWLQKARAMYWLVQPDSGDIAGYGWTGPETCPVIPNGEITFGIRISEHHQGYGLATPFLTAIIAVSRDHYQADNFWLETWQSNAGAGHVYQKLGFELMHQQASERPTAAGTTVKDVRLYMQLKSTLQSAMV